MQVALQGNELMVLGMVLCDTNVYVKSMRVFVVLQLRCACLLRFNSSTCMITLTFKGNKLMVVGEVKCGCLGVSKLDAMFYYS
jgi:hypothetical protein